MATSPARDFAVPFPWVPLTEMESRFRSVLAASVAEETELVWLECERRQVATRTVRSAPPATPHERTVLVRVIDSGRLGQHRTVACDTGELEGAVRHALAQARVNPALASPFHFPSPEPPLAVAASLDDRALRELDEPGAVRRLQALVSRHELASLRWTVGRVAIFNSRGMARLQAFTAATLTVSCGRRPGAGRAERSARSLAGLAAAEVVATARAVHATAGPVATEVPPVGPALLSPLAVAALLDLLNRTALSARAYREGVSVLRQHLGVQVFDRRFALRDDATDMAGLPFPFDLEGTSKRPVDLVVDGKPSTPALDQRQAAIIGLAATGNAISGDDARAEHLAMQPGDADEANLRQAADGGLWVGWIEAAECFDPAHGGFRALLRGVRQIRDGVLAEAVPDLVWEDSLMHVFAALPAIGSELVTLARGTFGATRAPAMVVPALHNLELG
jgi:predicted Zn-dependent protease